MKQSLFKQRLLRCAAQKQNLPASPFQLCWNDEINSSSFRPQADPEPEHQFSSTLSARAMDNSQ